MDPMTSNIGSQLILEMRGADERVQEPSRWVGQLPGWAPRR